MQFLRIYQFCMLFFFILFQYIRYTRILALAKLIFQNRVIRRVRASRSLSFSLFSICLRQFFFFFLNMNVRLRYHDGIDVAICNITHREIKKLRIFMDLHVKIRRTPGLQEFKLYSSAMSEPL